MVRLIEGPCGCWGCAKKVAKKAEKKAEKLCAECGCPGAGGWPYEELCEACAERKAS